MILEKKARAYDLLRECEQLQNAIRERQRLISGLAQEIAELETVAKNVSEEDEKIVLDET